MRVFLRGGRSFVELSGSEEFRPPFPAIELSEQVQKIAAHVAPLIRDGDTIEVGAGSTSEAIVQAGVFAGRCNTDLVELEEPTAADLDEVRVLVEEHGRRTGSAVAERLLARWGEQPPAFVKVMPRDYKQALARQAEAAEATV